MDNNSFYSWNELIALVVVLAGGFMALWLLLVVLQNFGKRDLFKRKAIEFLSKGILIYATLAVGIILLGFISINYITHGLLLAFIGVFCFRYIRDLISGLFLKINNSIQKGDSIVSGEVQGDVEQLLLFGAYISNRFGKSFINYSTLYNQGFTVKSDKLSLFRKMAFLKTERSRQQITDLLFENPAFSFSDPPEVETTAENGKYVLHYTLEHGSSSEDLTAFLQEYQIASSSEDKD
ncbi:MAG: hypothetical protein R3204_13520 [Oceanospirillum sp.]|nr:hypothetical protein [Oceanospirillum sp.]